MAAAQQLLRAGKPSYRLPGCKSYCSLWDVGCRDKVARLAAHRASSVKPKQQGGRYRSTECSAAVQQRPASTTKVLRRLRASMLTITSTQCSHRASASCSVSLQQPIVPNALPGRRRRRATPAFAWEEDQIRRVEVSQGTAYQPVLQQEQQQARQEIPRKEQAVTSSKQWYVRLLSTALAFVRACFSTLRQLSAPSLPDAINRLCLILGVSLCMILVITTLDSTSLWLYVAHARRLA